MIKNVVFDIGMVLVDFRFREYMKDLGLSPEEISNVAAHMIYNPLWNELDRGIRSFEVVMAQMKAQHPEEATLYDRFWKDPTEVCRPFPKTRAWLMSVRDAGYDVYLLSNYPKELFECHWAGSFDFTDIPKGRVVSYEVGLTKPEPEIYRKLLEKYELQPEECVFLDDRKENVEAAEALGFFGIHVMDQEQAMSDLKAFLETH